MGLDSTLYGYVKIDDALRLKPTSSRSRAKSDYFSICLGFGTLLKLGLKTWTCNVPHVRGY